MKFRCHAPVYKHAGEKKSVRLSRELQAIIWRKECIRVPTGKCSQYLESYHTVSLPSMAATFGIRVDFLDRELSDLVACGRLRYVTEAFLLAEAGRFCVEQDRFGAAFGH